MPNPSVKKQKYHLSWPLNPEQVENIDEMFGHIHQEVADAGFSGDENEVVLTDEEGDLTTLTSVVLGNVLISGGVGEPPTWDKADLTLHVEGILPVENGGTGVAGPFTAGSVVFAGTSGIYAQDNANLFFDNTTNMFGVGTATPLRPLHIHHNNTPVLHLTTDTSGQAITDGLDLFIFTGNAALLYREAGNLTLGTNATNMVGLYSGGGISLLAAISDPGAGIVEINGTLKIDTALDELYGGTGTGTFTQGDILYSSAANTLAKLAKNTTATRYLSNTGTDNNPAWAQVDVTNGVTGALPIANGGTNATSFTSTRVPYFDGTRFVDDADLTFATDTLTATKLSTTQLRSTASANNNGTVHKLLYGATTDSATAVELTTDGAAGSGATNRIAVPSNAALSVVLNICVKQSGAADAKQMLRQFVISNNGGTTALQGAVTVLGTDVGSAGLATVTTTITANDTDDCIKVEVNGVAATNLRYTAYVVSAETIYA